jgi:hypothetical protein
METELHQVESVGYASIVDVQATGCCEATSQEVMATPSPHSIDECKKEPPATVREFERALCGLGFSKRRSAAIARQGFKPADAAGEARSEQLNQIKTLLQSSMSKLKKD